MPRYDRPVCGMFFWDDFRSDPVVRKMESAARGIYMSLLCAAWNEDPPATLPNDHRILARLGESDSVDQFVSLWPQIEKAFAAEGDRLVQKRLRETWQRANSSLIANRERQSAWLAKRKKTADDSEQNSKSLTVSETVEKPLKRRFSSGSGSGSGNKKEEKGSGEEKKTKSKLFDPSEIVIPESLNEPRFVSKWRFWISYRMKLKKPKDPAEMFRLQLETLVPFGIDQSIEAINKSVMNGYQGIFPEHQKGNGTSRKTDPARSTVTPGCICCGALRKKEGGYDCACVPYVAGPDYANICDVHAKCRACCGCNPPTWAAPMIEKWERKKQIAHGRVAGESK